MPMRLISAIDIIILCHTREALLSYATDTLAFSAVLLCCRTYSAYHSTFLTDSIISIGTFCKFFIIVQDRQVL